MGYPAQGYTISQLVRLCHDTAKAKGWHQKHEDLLAFIYKHAEDPDHATDLRGDADASRFGALLALVDSEVAEALEAYREHGLHDSKREDGKPEGVASELADILIRVCDMCGYFGIDLESAIEEKMRFNETRPYRHGDKRL